MTSSETRNYLVTKKTFGWKYAKKTKGNNMDH